LLADLLLVFHFSIAAFIVLGADPGLDRRLPGWRWVRNPWFRYLHLAAIAFVAAEALLGIACPLTVWEDLLRGGARPETFRRRWVYRLLYYNAPEWVFTALYAAWAAATLLTLRFVPAQAKRWLKRCRGSRAREHQIVQPAGKLLHGDLSPRVRDQLATCFQSRTMSASSECIDSTGQRATGRRGPWRARRRSPDPAEIERKASARLEREVEIPLASSSCAARTYAGAPHWGSFMNGKNGPDRRAT
jgi:hypothetical protein